MVKLYIHSFCYACIVKLNGDVNVKYSYYLMELELL